MKLTDPISNVSESVPLKSPRDLVRTCLDRMVNGDLAVPSDAKCNSPIEHIFFQEFEKFKGDSVLIHRQYHCPTHAGRFYLDFLLTIGTKRIGIECDGREFHDAAKDEVRDMAILEEGYADIIYRMHGADLFHRVHDVLDLLRSREPELFSKRGLANLEPLATHKSERQDDVVTDRPGHKSGLIRHVTIHDESGETLFEKDILLSWRESYSNEAKSSPPSV